MHERENRNSIETNSLKNNDKTKPKSKCHMGKSKGNSDDYDYINTIKITIVCVYSVFHITKKCWGLLHFCTHLISFSSILIRPTLFRLLETCHTFNMDRFQSGNLLTVVVSLKWHHFGVKMTFHFLKHVTNLSHPGEFSPMLYFKSKG